MLLKQVVSKKLKDLKHFCGSYWCLQKALGQSKTNLCSYYILIFVKMFNVCQVV